MVAGCEDSCVPALEQRVKQLEGRIHQLEAERTKNVEDNSALRAKLESCVADANADFQKNSESNGTKARNGSYNVSVPLLEQMQRQKQSKIEECRLLYSK
jgi:predicted RNase H-like nuclease (RuvC/YqgF family)